MNQRFFTLIPMVFCAIFFFTLFPSDANAQAPARKDRAAQLAQILGGKGGGATKPKATGGGGGGRARAPKCQFGEVDDPTAKSGKRCKTFEEALDEWEKTKAKEREDEAKRKGELLAAEEMAENYWLAAGLGGLGGFFVCLLGFLIFIRPRINEAKTEAAAAKGEAKLAKEAATKANTDLEQLLNDLHPGEAA